MKDQVNLPYIQILFQIDSTYQITYFNFTLLEISNKQYPIGRTIMTPDDFLHEISEILYFLGFT